MAMGNGARFTPLTLPRDRRNGRSVILIPGCRDLPSEILTRTERRRFWWSGGGSSTGADYLYFADPQTGTVEWKSIHIDGPLSAVDVGDVDGDGDDEIVMVPLKAKAAIKRGLSTSSMPRPMPWNIVKSSESWTGWESVRSGSVIWMVMVKRSLWSLRQTSTTALSGCTTVPPGR